MLATEELRIKLVLGDTAWPRASSLAAKRRLTGCPENIWGLDSGAPVR